MRSFVAFLIVTILALTGTVAQNQTVRRKVAKNEISKPGNDTMKICQGLAIPPGYVIVGDMTSSACPHGGYVLKKQTNFESSLPIDRTPPTNEGESSLRTAGTSAAPSNTTAGNSSETPRRKPKSEGGAPSHEH